MKNRKTILPLVLVLVISFGAWAQEAEIAERVKMVDEGNAGQVKQELPSLVAKYQNHPGVLYLQGRLASNGAEAAKHYQSVIDNFPQSEWADDALYRIYLYYYSLGLSRTAELKMQQLRKEYPNSPFIREKSSGQTVEVREPEAERKPEVEVVTPHPRTKDTTRWTPPKIIETRREMQPVSGAYALQVGAFSLIENAAKLKGFFEELGYSVEVQNKVRGGRSLHLVWVGSFATADEARRFGAEVRMKHRVESIVVTR